MKELNADIHNAKMHIRNSYNKDLFDFIYPFCNENIKELLSYFSLRDKDCLSVLASTDQVFDMYLKGAKSITTFDINNLTKYYYKLKKAAMMAGLTFEDYKKFFCFEEYNNHRSNKNAFDYNEFNIIKKYLDKDSYLFWAELYNCFSSLEIRTPFGLFTYDEPSCQILEKTVGYFNESSYKELQKNINKLSIEFINANIKSLPAYLHSKFDFMYFSNIIQYCDSLFSNYDNLDKINNQETKLLKMKNVLKYLATYLKQDGFMVAGYLYEPKYLDKDVAIFNKELRNKVFGNDNFYNIYIRSIQSIMSTEVMEETNLNQDMCLIYKK